MLINFLKKSSNSAVKGSIAWVVCLIAGIFYYYEYVLRAAPSVMSNNLMSDFNLTATQFGDMAAYYYYIYTPLQIFVGVLIDKYGPKKLLVVACAMCTLGALIFGQANSLFLLKFSRFLMGFGSAFAFVGSLKLVSIWFARKWFASISGVISTLGMLGGMTADIVLTNFIAIDGWRQTILLTFWAGLVLTVIMVFCLKDGNSATATNTPAVTFKALFKNLYQITKNRNIWLAGFIGFILYLSMSAFAELWGVPFLQTVYQLSAKTAASLTSLIFLGWAIGGPIVCTFSDILKSRRLPLFLGSLISAIILALLIFNNSLSIMSLSILLFLFGFFTSVELLIFAIGQDECPPQIAGSAIALINLIVMIGGMIFQPLLGFLLDLTWNGTSVAGVRNYSAANYQIAFGAIFIAFVVAIVLTCLLRQKK